MLPVLVVNVTQTGDFTQNITEKTTVEFNIACSNVLFFIHNSEHFEGYWELNGVKQGEVSSKNRAFSFADYPVKLYVNTSADLIFSSFFVLRDIVQKCDSIMFTNSDHEDYLVANSGVDNYEKRNETVPGLYENRCYWRVSPIYTRNTVVTENLSTLVYLGRPYPLLIRNTTFISKSFFIKVHGSNTSSSYLRLITQPYNETAGNASLGWYGNFSSNGTSSINYHDNSKTNYVYVQENGDFSITFNGILYLEFPIPYFAAFFSSSDKFYGVLYGYCHNYIGFVDNDSPLVYFSNAEGVFTFNSQKQITLNYSLIDIMKTNFELECDSLSIISDSNAKYDIKNMYNLMNKCYWLVSSGHGVLSLDIDTEKNYDFVSVDFIDKHNIRISGEEEISYNTNGSMFIRIKTDMTILSNYVVIKYAGENWYTQYNRTFNSANSLIINGAKMPTRTYNIDNNNYTIDPMLIIIPVVITVLFFGICIFSSCCCIYIFRKHREAEERAGFLQQSQQPLYTDQSNFNYQEQCLLPSNNVYHDYSQIASNPYDSDKF